jgi:hypothetical protein
VFSFHRSTLKALSDMLSAAGLSHPRELGPHHMVRRVTATEIKLFSQMHTFLKPGELLSGETQREFYTASWAMARADSFDAIPAAPA